MRRTAVPAVVFVFVLIGLTAASFAPVATTGAKAMAASGKTASGGNAGGAGTTSPAAQDTGGTKVVSYDGYQISVPANWPVYQLNRDPRQCVRYDVHAVYLGTPSPSQDCPAGIIGKTQTVVMSAGGVSGTASGRAMRSAAGRQGPAAAGGSSAPVNGTAIPGSGSTEPAGGSAMSAAGTSALPHVRGRFRRLGQFNEYQASASESSLSVSATYGGDPAQAERVLKTLRKWQPSRSAASPAYASPSGPGAPAPQAGSASPGSPSAPASPAGSAARPGSANRPQAAAVSDTPRSPLPGFDTCTAPSLQAMKAWRSQYSAAGIYIGGQDMACNYGNLSASWVSSAKAMGWSMMPIYVGPQAPCNSFSAPIKAADAAQEGMAAARNAVSDATTFGIGKRSPIYYDMEGYDHTNVSCRTAVLTFLGAWTRQLHAEGYVSAVYSSASSGIIDLATISQINGLSLTKPDAVWLALWDNQHNLIGTPYLPGSLWASDRSKQYAGPHNQNIGGYMLNIDSDLVGSAVYR